MRGGWRHILRASGRRGFAPAVTALATTIGVLLMSAGPAMAGRIEPGKTQATGTLAFTGLNAVLLIGVGTALIAAGLTLRWFAPLGRDARQRG